MIAMYSWSDRYGYRRVLRRVDVRETFRRGQERFKATLAEVAYWKDKAREFEEALIRTAKEADHYRAERDEILRINRELITTHTASREASANLIRLLEERDREMRGRLLGVEVDRVVPRQALH
jgi:hypothetical protein